MDVLRVGVQVPVVASETEGRMGRVEGQPARTRECKLGCVFIQTTVYPDGWFFFSSRRRHTRYIGDWSSDVCSSDLIEESDIVTQLPAERDLNARDVPTRVAPQSVESEPEVRFHEVWGAILRNRWPILACKIGRASCRERGEVSEVVGSWRGSTILRD